MSKQTRFSALALAGALGVSLFMPSAAHASSEGRRNTAIALGALALGAIVYGASHHGDDDDRYRDWRGDEGYSRYGYGYSRGYGGYERYGYGRGYDRGDRHRGGGGWSRSRGGSHRR